LQNPPSAAISTSSTIDRRRLILKGGAVGEDKGNGLAGLRELADRFEIFAVETDRGSQKKTLFFARTPSSLAAIIRVNVRSGAAPGGQGAAQRTSHTGRPRSLACRATTRAWRRSFWPVGCRYPVCRVRQARGPTSRSLSCRAMLTSIRSHARGRLSGPCRN